MSDREVMDARTRALASKYVWFETYDGRRLHFIAEAEPEGYADGKAFWERACWGSTQHPTAAAICGTRSVWIAPGIFSRMGMPRCSRCCRALGISDGNGCPLNEEALR